MCDKSKRATFSPELKAKVGLEAIRGVKTINEIGQEFGVHPGQMSLWKKDILDGAQSLFAGKRGPKPVNDRSAPDRLYSEIGRLKIELDWLIKSRD